MLCPLDDSRQQFTFTNVWQCRSERPFLKSERTQRLWSRGILEMPVECAAG
jgi:hypothetical protein